MAVPVQATTLAGRSSAARWWTGPRLMALGLLALQITWAFSVPPFRGSDEFDHVYRAAAAARGQVFVTPASATRGTGAWLEVPNDIVAAARPQCQDLGYTRAEDCVGTPGESATRIASGAGRYHPLFYLLVGTAGLPFDGISALYAMRLATILLTWLLFVLAIAATQRWAKTPWPLACIALASTPVLVYSSSVVAPNGVEMMVGLALWTGLLGVLQEPRRNDRLLISTVAVAGSILVTLRSLGPLWCLLAVLTAIAATAPWKGGARELASRRSTWVVAGIVLAATILGVAWTLSMHALNIGQEMQKHISTGLRLHYLFQNEPLWTLQTIAAFPLRNEPAPVPVYACYLVIYAGLAYLGLRAARQLGRAWIIAAIALAIVVASAVPFIIGLNPNSYPGLWQGRYALPYSVGIAVLIGFALDTAGTRLTARLRAVGLLLFVTAQAISPVDVLLKGTRHQLSDYADFPHPPPVVIALSAAAAAALLWWGATGRDPGRDGAAGCESAGDATTAPASPCDEVGVSSAHADLDRH